MSELAKLLKQFRSQVGWNATEAAKRLAITPQYLSRIENGAQIPSLQLLEQMISDYVITTEDANLLREIAGYESAPRPTASSPTTITQNMEVKINAENTPVYFSNALFVSSDPYGIVIDAGQKVGPSNQIQIVSRLGISLEHAEKLSEALSVHIKNLKKLEN